jgi:hypothetical protein
MAPTANILAGKTSACLPSFDAASLAVCEDGNNPVSVKPGLTKTGKQRTSTVGVPVSKQYDAKGRGWSLKACMPALLVKWLGLFNSTPSHWSNNFTSIDWLDHIAVPFLLKRKAELGLPADSKSILLVDTWWGWLEKKEFLPHAKRLYPWLFIIFVPANCT